MTFTGTESIASLRTQLTERRMVRQRRRRLADEISSYTTASDRAELEALIGRATPEDARDLEAAIQLSLQRSPAVR